MTIPDPPHPVTDPDHSPESEREETGDEPFPLETLERIHEAFVAGLEADYPGTTWRVV
jgi:hypothetical protein